MPFNTGDLVPQQSGSASIGARQTGLHSFSSSLFPYAHLHMNSGVWHDPMLGQSGIIRFVQNNDASFIDESFDHQVAGRQNGFEISVDGGTVFPLLIGATHHIASGQGGAESFMAEGGEGGGSILASLAEGGASHMDEPQEAHQVGVIRTPDGFRHDLYLYASGVNTVIGSKQLNLFGFGGGDSTNDYSVFIHAALDLKAQSIADLDVRTAVGHMFFQPGLSSSQGDFIVFPGDGNSWLHFRQYGVGGFFGGTSSHQAWHVKNGPGIDISGPVGNGEWPIAHSGQVAAMIAAAGGGSQSLQAAYTGGNEINLVRNVNDRSVGVVAKEATGKAMLGLQQAPSLTHLDYGIAVSGGTGANGFAFTKLIPNGIIVKSSGTSTVTESSIVFGYNANSPHNALVASNHTVDVIGLENAILEAGTANQPGGQVDLSAFIGSGRIQYRYGPHQSWAMKVRNIATGGPASDGFWPIPHSGYIDTMILRAIKTKAITIERPAVNQDITIWYTNEPITITEVESVLRGAFDASGSFAIRYGSDRTQVGTSITTLPMECHSRTTGLITTSFASAEIPADNWLWIGVSGVSGVQTSQLHVTLQYK